MLYIILGQTLTRLSGILASKDRDMFCLERSIPYLFILICSTAHFLSKMEPKKQIKIMPPPKRKHPQEPVLVTFCGYHQYLTEALQEGEVDLNS